MRHNKNNNVPVNNQMPPVTRLADSVLSLAVLTLVVLPLALADSEQRWSAYGPLWAFITREHLLPAS